VTFACRIPGCIPRSFLLCEPDFQRRTVRYQPLPNRFTLHGIFGKRIVKAKQKTKHSDKIAWLVAIPLGRDLFLYEVE
jgi:hypothetical protein